jgi:hypothetical protein
MHARRGVNGAPYPSFENWLAAQIQLLLLLRRESEKDPAQHVSSELRDNFARVI